MTAFIKDLFRSVKWLIFLTAMVRLPLDAQPAKHNINIVFIGNSITHGVQLNNAESEAPPAVAAAYLRTQPGIGEVAFSNQGYSGYTTLNFLPGGQTFNQVEQAAKSFSDKHALLIFSIKLGTNDSAIEGPLGSPVSPEQYQYNLKAITDSLLAEFPACIVILQHPIWYSPNTYNGAKYLEEGLLRLQSYVPKIDDLVETYAGTHPKRVFVGDKVAFAYFKKHYLTDLVPESGHQGTFYLHPNKKGAEVLGTFWGKAIYKVIKQVKK